MQVHVPDRPGVFAGITQALGAARINIEDFALDHFTPERGGTIELLVAGLRCRRARRRAARRAGLRRARRAGAGGGRMSAATGADRLDVAPAAALVGEIAVPGDKSISHRVAPDRRGLRRRDRDRGFGANADTLATLAAVRGARRPRRAARRGRDASAHPRRGLRGLRRPAAPIDVAQRRHADAPAARAARRPERLVHARRRRVDPPPPGRPHRDAAQAPWAPCSATATAGRRCTSTAATSCSRSATSCRCVGAGQVVHPARRPLRRHRPDDRDRARADARPHRAPAARRGRAHRQGPAHRLGVAGRAPRARTRSTCPATSPRPRRSWSRRRCSPSRACSCAACRLNPTRTGLLTVLERMGARISLFNRRTTAAASRSPTSRCIRRARRDRDRGRDRAGADRRAAAARARGRHGARPHGRARRGRAAREGVEPPRDGRRAAARDRRPRARDRRRLGDPGRAGAAARRPRRAHGDHRIGMLGAVAGLVSRNGVRIDGASAIGVSYPAFAASSSAWRYGRGDRDRRARRGRQVDRRARGRGRARLPLPRHGRDVPRRRAGGDRSRRRRRRVEALAGLAARRDARRATPSCESRVDARVSLVARTRPVREALHRAQRAVPRRGRRGRRGPRRRRRRLARGGAQDLARRGAGVRARRRVREQGEPPPRPRSPSATGATPRRRCARRTPS